MGKQIKKLNNHLWTYRKKMGLSQKRVALLMGFKRTNDLSRYEHGVRMPSLVNALKLEIVYRTPAAFLYKGLYEELRKDIKAREEKLLRQREEE